MQRYLAMLWDPLNLESVRTFQSFGLSSGSKPAGWVSARDASGMFVMHTGMRHGSAEAYLLPNGGGVVLGRLFDRRQGDYTTTPRIDFNDASAREIVNSGGKYLVDHYWGTYFAVLHDANSASHHVFRDPLGSMPGYYTRFKGVDIFFSHIEDCVRLLPLRYSIDRQYLVRWLLFSGLTREATGIEGVTPLPSADRLTFSHGRMTRSVLWDPVEIASAADLDQLDAATSTLRTTVQDTINAWASCYDDITLRLSGGLDSSIVAGCLAQVPSPARVSYLNVCIDMESGQEQVVIPGTDRKTAERIRAIVGGGDERYFARMVAERWRTELIQRQRELAMDLTRLWDTAPTVNPNMYFTVMELEDIQLDLISSRGTQAFFSGQAGDSVFQATIQPLPALDQAYLHGLGRGLWEQILATTRLSKESLWSVLGKTVRHGLLRRPYVTPMAILSLPTLVSAELSAGLSSQDFESELARRISRAALPPGKKDHIKGLTWSAWYDYVFDSGRYADHIDPLNSLPVWETMLRIPTSTVLVGGISRGLARRAFADVLPAEIRKRQVKGSGNSFYQQIIKRHRSLFRERLLDGLLVEQGYLDRARLDACLAAPEPALVVPAPILLCYLAAEAWLQKWSGAAQSTAVPHSLSMSAQ
ncbi:MAG TPA: asparagine synthase-related protein [Steroidobacter sp.]|uniref:asparagine synthase-related protein n=1 Tax=Steroidobacter sp. TaxID=1978227 RepID=UPI002ED950B4